MSAPAEQVSRSTTMAALKPAPEQAVQNLPAVTMGFASLQSFELMQRAAKLLSASTLVPQQYQGNLPNCVIALNMAQRIGADPLMVMQNLYVVHNRPGWSAQFLIACFNQCGRFSAIRYKWFGSPGQEDWGCQAYAKELSDGETILGPLITIALAKKEGWYSKSGSKWQSIPQLMLMYRAASWLVRTHAPEISMGLQTAEELHDVYDATSGADGQYAVTTESLRQLGDAIESAAGEITNTSGPSTNAGAEPADHKARFDAASAIAEIKKAKTQAALDKAFEVIALDFRTTDRELPIEVEAAFNDRAETLKQ